MIAWKAHLVIALSNNEVWIRRSGHRLEKNAVAAPIPVEGGYQSLTATVQSFMDEHQLTNGVVDVVLLPPLVSVRVLEMPRLTAAEIQHVIERSPDRFFPSAREPQLIATKILQQKRGVSSRILTAAAPQAAVDAIRAALLSAGLTTRTVGCAHDIWIAVARRDRHTRAVIAAAGENVELIEMSYGAVLNIRRMRPSSIAAYTVPRNGTKPSLFVIAPEDNRLALPSAETDYAVWKNNAAPGEFCVNGRLPRRRLLLRDPVERKATGTAQARRATVFLLAALMLAMAAARLDRLRQDRELNGIRRDRNEAQSEVAAAIAARQAAQESRSELINFQNLEWEAERWTKVVVGLSEHLPLDTRILSFRARHDSVVIEGYSLDPQGAFNALRESSLFMNLRAAAPVKRETAPDGQPQLRFLFHAEQRPMPRP